MESLGSVLSFFSQKVKEKVSLLRSLQHGGAGAEVRLTPFQKVEVSADANVVLLEAYRSVRSLVEAELREGTVSFSHRTESGSRTLLRLHRSLLWLKLTLEGLAEGPRAPGDLGR